MEYRLLYIKLVKVPGIKKAIGLPFIKKVINSLYVKKLYSKRARRKLSETSDFLFADRSPKDVFTKIYKEQMWGRGNDTEFYSGSGSHTEEIVDTYVATVHKFLLNFPQKPNAVDLGCGDFNVGKKLREFCENYVACDVVPQLIERNKNFYKDSGVRFKCIDICKDQLPIGDVVFVRQVFQHLSNNQIVEVVPKLGIYKYLVVTEALPFKSKFVSNIDKPIGDGIRCLRGRTESGIVLTLPPFNLQAVSESVLSEVPVGRIARIRTIAYKLQ